MATGTIKTNALQSFTPTWGTMVTNASDVSCYKYGNIVNIDATLTITATTAKSISGLFTVPQGYRPVGVTFMVAIDNTNDLFLNCSIGATGSCNAYRNHSTSMSTIRFHAMYLTNE